jgi:hypothetical protein
MLLTNLLLRDFTLKRAAYSGMGLENCPAHTTNGGCCL